MNPESRRRQQRKSISSLLESLEGRSLFAAASTTEVLANLSDPKGLTAIESYLAKNKSSELGKYISISQSKQLFASAKTSTIQLRLVTGANVDGAIKLLKAVPGVQWASKNYNYGKGTADLTPNDPRWEYQADPLAKAQLPQAWDLQTGTGSGAPIVAVVDDGVDYTHEDLAGAVYTNPGEIAGDGIDNDNNGFIDDVHGWDFGKNDNSPLPDLDTATNLVDSHGTLVASIIAAPMNNNLGIAGVAGGGGVKLLPVRFRGVGVDITSAGLAQAIAYAANSGAKIINLSYSIDPNMDDPAFQAAVDLAYEKGVLYLNSAGNNTDGVTPRTKITKGLFVANVDATDTKYENSNWGRGIDLSAPGTEIRGAAPINTYFPVDGTSFSTAVASGIAALIWSKNPTWTRDQVAAQLVGTGDNIDALNPAYATLLGAGRVNAFKALSTTLAAPKVRGLEGLADGAVVTSAALDSFTLRLLNVLKASTVGAGSITLAEAGADGAFGTGDDKNISLAMNGSYFIGTNELSFNTGTALAAGKYRFSVKDTITDPFGTKLDGNNDGIAGGDYVVNFTVAPQGPAAPGNFAGVRSTTSQTEINLSWIDNSANETSFIIDRSLTPTFTTIDKVLTAVENGTHYIDWGLTIGQTYYYRIRSASAHGTSANSPTVSVALTAPTGVPAAPTGFAAAKNPETGDTTAMLSWVDNSTNETSFQVQRSTNSTFATIDRDFQPRADSNWYVDWGMTAGVTYYYRIRAVNGVEASAWSPTLTWNSNGTTPAPTAPTTLAVAGISGTPTSAKLTWVDKAGNETSYVLERSTSSTFASGITSTTLAANATTATVTGLTTNTTYYFRVKAVNATGSSAYSNVVNYKPVALTKPSAPSSLAVAAVSGTPSSAKLTWKDNASNEAKFEIQRSTSSTFASGVTTFTLPANTTTYTDTGLTLGTKYYWRVRAVNTAGNSAYTGTVNFTPPKPQPPKAPSNLKAAAGTPNTTSIKLTWTDNATNETKFEIQRSTSSAFTSVTTITLNTPNTVTYTNTGLTTKTTYYYRIRAVNAAGNSSWSSTVSLKTK